MIIANWISFPTNASGIIALLYHKIKVEKNTRKSTCSIFAGRSPTPFHRLFINSIFLNSYNVIHVFLYMASVPSPPAVSLKDIIEQEQCQDSSNVDSMNEVRAFLRLFSVHFIRTARLKNICPWSYCNRITSQITSKLP